MLSCATAWFVIACHVGDVVCNAMLSDAIPFMLYYVVLHIVTKSSACCMMSIAGVTLSTVD